ncbi:L-rhamnose mutarotase [Brevundimonas sp. SORGH_AS_0993]|uniref:L-rhamnose mutarotase n=1 Tax=Brevundimonas sp. SORGH_AS_0993 TaxID=3041794 RepID=UPI0027844E4C|nr:L-rhamnose mutarotase [Brevundimonas sp. SORGH_AS_0993]MDQ1155160.1 L-rhamnose mutarotase [Brevundimonas sp. SORGH_AS_0993]
MRTQRVVRIMDLATDAAAIAAYDEAHRAGRTPVAVVEAQHRHGIVEMEIFRAGHRLVMILTLAEDFDAEGLQRIEREHPELIAWQARMAELQRAPFADGEPWPVAHRVFRQSDHLSNKDRI